MQPSSTRKQTAFCLTLWILPFLRALALIYQYGVNILFDDDFDLGDFLNKVHSHGLRWVDLIAQHNESRFVTIRLLSLGLAGVHHPFDVRLLMLASVVTVAITGILLLRLSRRTFGDTPAAWMVAIMANMLLLLPSQWQNFLWGVQWIVFVPAATLVLGLVALDEDIPLLVGFPAAMFSTLFASYTNSNGFILWGLLLPTLSLRKSLLTTLGWILIAGLSTGYYFHHYSHPGASAVYHPFPDNPLAYITFLLAFLGNGVRCTDNVNTAAELGAGAVLLTLIALGIQVRATDRRLLSASLPWITLAAYSIVSGMLATAGRIGSGMEAAIPPRYPTFAIPLYIALIVLWFLTTKVLHQRWQIPSGIAALPACIIIVVLIGFALRSSRYVSGEQKHYYAARLTGLALVQWSNLATDEHSMIHALFPSPGMATQTLAEMDRNGYSPKDLFINQAQAAAILDSASPSASGGFDSLTLDHGQLHAAGWAKLPDRAADTILFTIKERDGSDRVIAITGDVRRPHIVAGKSTETGWDRIIPVSMVPRGTDVCAWSYDAISRRAYRIGGQINPQHP